LAIGKSTPELTDIPLTAKVARSFWDLLLPIARKAEDSDGVSEDKIPMIRQVPCQSHPTNMG
jgi:hypothetical protein